MLGLSIALVVAFYLVLGLVDISANHVNFDDVSLFLFATVRHGARSPLNYVDKNSNRDSLGGTWTIKPGELTNVGIRQHYILGSIYREKYGALLNDAHQPGLFYAMSTDKNRTIQSYLAFYQGLFPDGDEIKLNQIKMAVPPGLISKQIQDVANDETNLAAVGKHTSIQGYHTLEDTENYHNLYYWVKGSPYCKAYPNYLTDSNDRIKANIQKLLDLNTKELEDHNIAIDQSNIPQLRNQLYNFADSYISNYFEGNPLAGDKTFFEHLSSFFYLDTIEGVYGDQDSMLARINKSKFLRRLIEYLKFRSDPPNEGNYNTINPRMVLYVWHDVDLVEIMITLNYAFKLNFKILPTFASFINFELLKSVSGNAEFQVAVTMNDQEILKIKLDTFIATLERILISDDKITEYCGLSNQQSQVDNSQSSTPYIIAIVLISVSILGLAFYLIYDLKKKTANRSEQASHAQ